MFDFPQIRTVAIVGLSNKPERDSFKVAQYLQKKGLRVIPVNPALEEVLGETCYPDLLAIPHEIKVDVVDVFRKSDEVMPVAYGALEIGAKTLWLQEGVVNHEAAQVAKEAGLNVIMDQCIKKKYAAWTEENQENIYDVLIVGAGPAGLTAALYTSRAGLKTVIMEAVMPGGQIATTESIENYPGFDQPVSGPDLMVKFTSQAMNFGAQLLMEEVTEADLAGHLKIVRSGDVVRYARALIIASGAKSRSLGAVGEDGFRGRGVSYCATCDGALYKDKQVVVVGGGNSAVEEAAFLTKFAEKVTIIHRRDQLRASKVLQERAQDNPRISFIWDTAVEEITGQQVVEKVKIRNLKTNEVGEIPCQGVFIYVGNAPSNGYLKGQVELTPQGYIQVNSSLETNVAGVFACGDIRDTPLRQVATAVGDGAIAAMSAEKYISGAH